GTTSGRGSASACASRRSSGVSVHRHVNCATPLPVTPTIFTSVAAPHVERMAAAIAARRRRGSSPLVAATEPTNANPRSGPLYQKIPPRVGPVAGGPGGRERGDQQPDDAEALAPWSTAESQPPRDNRHAAGETAARADE